MEMLICTYISLFGFGCVQQNKIILRGETLWAGYRNRAISNGGFGKKAGGREELQMPFFLFTSLALLFVVSFLVLVLCVCVMCFINKAKKSYLF